jgi:hypothetical protein
LNKKKRCESNNIKIEMETCIKYKRRHRRRYINKNLIARINNKCKCGGIRKEIKLVFEM